MASANAKTPKNLKSGPPKKAASPTKKKGPTSPTKEKGKEKVNGEVKGKGKAVNGAAAGAVPKASGKETKSPVEKCPPKEKPNNNEDVRNGINTDATTGDFGMDNFNHQMQADLMIGDLQVIFLTETDTKYGNTKHQSVTKTPGDATSDVTLEVDEKTFKCHKSVLTTASTYFVDLLKGAKSDPIIVDKDIGSETFEILLESLYDGYVVLNRDLSQGFFDAAASLDIPWLKDAAADNLMRTLGPDNHLIVGQLFQKHDLPNLKKQTESLVAHNLIMFSESNEFLENMEFDVLKNILSTNEYVEGSEGFIVKVILDWVHMDKENRQKHLEELAKLIRFPMLEPEELDRLPSELTRLPGMSKRIEQAKNYGLNLSSQSLFDGEDYCPRGSRNIVALISASEMNNGNIVLYKDPNKPHEPICIEHLEPEGLKTEMMFTAQAVLGNFLYIAGGYNQDNTSSVRMFRYDPRFRIWIELAPMTHSRVSFAMCASDKKLFAVGGIERTFEEEKETETSLDTAETYNPEDNTWKELPSLPYGCSEHAVAYCDGQVYISGGISSSPMDPIPLDYLHALKVAGGEKWESLTPMFTGRQGHSLSNIKGKLFVMGGKCGGGIGIQGFENCMTAEMYSPSTKQWTKMSSLPDGIGMVSRFVTVFDSKLAFISGQHLNYYDSDKDEFTEGDFCGPEVQRVVAVNTAYPPTV